MVVICWNFCRLAAETLDCAPDTAFAVVGAARVWHAMSVAAAAVAPVPVATQFWSFRVLMAAAGEAQFQSFIIAVTPTLLTNPEPRSRASSLRPWRREISPRATTAYRWLWKNMLDGRSDAPRSRVARSRPNGVRKISWI